MTRSGESAKVVAAGDASMIDCNSFCQPQDRNERDCDADGDGHEARLTHQLIAVLASNKNVRLGVE